MLIEFQAPDRMIYVEAHYIIGLLPDLDGHHTTLYMHPDYPVTQHRVVGDARAIADRVNATREEGC